MSRAHGHDRREAEFPPLPARASARAAGSPLPLPYGGLPLDMMRRLMQYEAAQALALVEETKSGGLTPLDVPSTFP